MGEWREHGCVRCRPTASRGQRRVCWVSCWARWVCSNWRCGCIPSRRRSRWRRWVSYVWIYTPLKRRTGWATVVGAVPGALPPVIGWTAARGALGIEALVLFGIVFLWQMPHFHALCWLYRDDYVRAGLPLLAATDPDGRRTARHALGYTAALVPVSLAPAFVGLAGMGYLAVAAVLGLLFVLLAILFLRQPTERRARSLFVGSLVYLPVLWSALLVERVL